MTAALEQDMKVLSVNLSEKKGTIKHPVPEIVIDDQGVGGDAHAGEWHRQVSMLSREIIQEFEAQVGRKISPGEFAENITVDGADLRGVSVLDRFVAGDLDLQVTQIGKECHGATCAIFREVGKCVMPKEGIFCRVLKGGTLKAGDELVHLPRPLAIQVITLSDRAHRGAYQDRSGPAIESILAGFFKDKRWHLNVERSLLPDDPQKLKQKLDDAHGCDIVITTGGTGVGPHDSTPEVVTAFCDKMIPGIMESIRRKFADANPNALLSRSVAGVKGQTIVYVLPGSAKAVKEYMGEILKTMEHLIYMVHGLDVH